MSVEENDPAVQSPEDEIGKIAAIVHLSGPRRGQTEKLSGKTLWIESIDNGIKFIEPDESAPDNLVAVLHRSRESYEIETRAEHAIWINGEKTKNQLLASGDLIEVEHGPVLRFRLYPAGAQVYKSVADVFVDCVDYARRDGRPVWRQMPALFAGLGSELVTKTSLWFRIGVVIALAALSTIIVSITRQATDLEQRLAQEQERVQGLAQLLERAEQEALTREELEAVRSDIEQGLTAAEERVTALEIRSAAAKNVIANTAPSVVFILGSFGFEDPESGKPLRLTLDSDGEPLRLPGGRPLITLKGEGPLVEATYTGSAFIAAPNGILLTNRHVAFPWEKDDDATGIQQLGLVPVQRRLIGYLSDQAESFDIELVGVSEKFDIAVMRCSQAAKLRDPLVLSSTTPQAGDEVIVMGYPTGIRALLARAGESFVENLGESDELDFWDVAQALAENGLITPLASRGIIGQVTNDAIVYDAETTQGGSGGPVLKLNGNVAAINAAIIPEFGGSNLGVPIQHAHELMQMLEIEITE